MAKGLTGTVMTARQQHRKGIAIDTACENAAREKTPTHDQASFNLCDRVRIRGLVAAACFAEIGHSVVCVDNDEARVKQLREGGVPIFEEHLPELLAKHRGSSVVFTTDLGEAVEQSEAVFIAVGTPQGERRRRGSVVR